MSARTYHITDAIFRPRLRRRVGKPNIHRLLGLAKQIHIPSEAEIRRIHQQTIDKERALMRQTSIK